MKQKYDLIIDDGKPPFSNFENKVVRLVETRGLAMFSEFYIIDEIIEYIDIFLQKNDNKIYHKGKYENFDGEHIVDISEEIEIEIPQEITQKFSSFNNFNLIVYVSNIKGNIKHRRHIISSQGKCVVLPKHEIKDNKLKDVLIEIHCTSINNSLILSDFYEAFNHEYNHAYENYKRHLNKIKNPEIKTNFEYLKYQNYENRSDLIYSDNSTEEAFGWILYILWNKTEYNSWVTSAYSYLKGINSDRNSFFLDIKNCEAYDLYQKIKTLYIPEIKECSNLYLWVHIYNTISKNKISTNKDNKKEIIKRINNFKEKFIDRSEKQLNKFWIKLCRNASLWYDEKEFK